VFEEDVVVDPKDWNGELVVKIEFTD